MNLKTKIYLSNEVLVDRRLSSYDLGTYIALRSLFFDGRKDYFINIDAISYELYSRIDIGRKMKDALKQSVYNLSNLGLLKITKDFGKGNFALDLSPIYVDGKEEFYTAIYKKELKTIMNVSCKEDNLKMLRYFTILIKSINTLETVEDRGYVGFMPISYLTENAGGISKTSLIKYNAILEENKLIYTYHHDGIVVIGTEIKSIPNHYGRYKDRKLIKKYAEKIENYYEKNGYKYKNQV